MTASPSAASVRHQVPSCNQTRSDGATASAWLVASRSGHCGTTLYSRNPKRDCLSASSGSWKLRGVESLREATIACLNRCAECSRCRYVSVSLDYADCSWYTTCDETHSVPSGLWSGSLETWHAARCATAPLASRGEMLTADEWLHASKEGACGTTEYIPNDKTNPRACEEDQAGSWSFHSFLELQPTLELRPNSTDAFWKPAAAACLRRCATCANCRFISLSPRFEDCSWYSACPNVAQESWGFRSARADGIRANETKHTTSTTGTEAGSWSIPPGHVYPGDVQSELDALGQLRSTPNSAWSIAPARSDLAWSRRTCKPSRQGRRHGTPAQPAREANGSLLLLAVFSARALRREVIRCTWGKAIDERSRLSVRLRFIVGVPGSESNGDAAAVDETVREVGDELRTAVVEGLAASRIDSHAMSTKRRRRQVLHGSITKQLKLIAFLKWIVDAAPPEPLIGMADDDVFISVPSLAAHAHLLVRAMTMSGSQHVYVGQFNWYSWHPRTLVASGWSADSLGTALHHAQESWRNCSPTGSGWRSTGWGLREGLPAEAASTRARDSTSDWCVGPLAFAKGPLLLVSQRAVEWVVASAAFGRDAETSRQLATPNGLGSSVREHPQLLLEIGARDTLEDVQLGHWLAGHPTLRIVHMPWRDVWADNGLRSVRRLGRLLVAHQPPWESLAWLTEHTQRLWDAARRGRDGLCVRETFRCVGAPCTVGACAQDSGQRVCAARVSIVHDTVDSRRATCHANAKRGCQCNATSRHGRDASPGHWDSTCTLDREREATWPQVCRLSSEHFPVPSNARAREHRS